MAETGSRFTPRQLGSMFDDPAVVPEGKVQPTVQYLPVTIRDGQYYVNGLALPTTSPAQFFDGERVPVLIEDGKPVAILSHDARRSGIFEPARQIVGTVVEDIQVMPTNKTYNAYIKGPTHETITALAYDYDVWFRDQFQVTRLRIRKLLDDNGYPLFYQSALPTTYQNMLNAVQWAERTDVFLVTLATYMPTPGHGTVDFTHLLFRLNRREDEPYAKGKRATLGVFPGEAGENAKLFLVVPPPPAIALASSSTSMACTGTQRFTEIWADPSTPRFQYLSAHEVMPPGSNVFPDVAPNILWQAPVYIDKPISLYGANAESKTLNNINEVSISAPLMVTKNLEVIARFQYPNDLGMTGTLNHWTMTNTNRISYTLSLPMLGEGQCYFFAFTSALSTPLPETDPERFESWCGVILELPAFDPGMTPENPFAVTWSQHEAPFQDPPYVGSCTIFGSMTLGGGSISTIIGMGPMFFPMTGVKIYIRTGPVGSDFQPGFEEPVPEGFSLLTFVPWDPDDITPRYESATITDNRWSASSGAVFGGGEGLVELMSGRVLFDLGGSETVSRTGHFSASQGLFDDSDPVEDFITAVLPFSIALKWDPGDGTPEYYLTSPQHLEVDWNITSETTKQDDESPTGWADPPFDIQIGPYTVQDDDIGTLNSMVRINFHQGDFGTFNAGVSATAPWQGASSFYPAPPMGAYEYQWDADYSMCRQFRIHGYRQDGLFNSWVRLGDTPPGPNSQAIATVDYQNGHRDPYGNRCFIGLYTAANSTPLYGYIYPPGSTPVSDEEGEAMTWPDVEPAIYYHVETFFRRHTSHITIFSEPEPAGFFHIEGIWAWGESAETAVITVDAGREWWLHPDNSAPGASYSGNRLIEGHWHESQHSNAGAAGFAFRRFQTAAILDGNGRVRRMLVNNERIEDFHTVAATSNHIIWHKTSDYHLLDDPAERVYIYHTYIPTGATTLIAQDPGTTYAGPNAIPIDYNNGLNRGVHTADYRYEQSMGKIEGTPGRSRPDFFFRAFMGTPPQQGLPLLWDIPSGKLMFAAKDLLTATGPKNDPKMAPFFKPKVRGLTADSMPASIYWPTNGVQRHVVNYRKILQPIRRYRKS